jgi:hypothetical protein
MVHTVNAHPVVTAPLLLSVEEDNTLKLDGISISDIDSNVTPQGSIAVTLSADHGILSMDEMAATNLTFATGDGQKDELMTFSGKVVDVNKALKTFKYNPHPDYHGLEEVKVRINDQGFTGGLTQGIEASTHMSISVVAKNDAPSFTVPAPQTVNEDATLFINGVGVYDVDVDVGLRNAQFSVSLQVVSGKLSLRQKATSIVAAGLTFTTGDGFEDAAMVFSGNLADINAALSQLQYTGDSNSNANYVSESLTLWIQDMGIGNGPAGTALNDTVSIPIHVMAVNDAPSVLIPKQQTVVLRGYHIMDVDLDAALDICVDVSVANKQARVSLASDMELTLLGGTMSTYARKISFRATVRAANTALEELEYVRSPAFDGGDSISVTLNDCVSQALIGERTLIEIDINNRLDTTLAAKLPRVFCLSSRTERLFLVAQLYKSPGRILSERGSSSVSLGPQRSRQFWSLQKS